MADDAPAPAPSGAPPIDYNAIIQQIMQGSGPVTGPAAPATPAVNPNLPITSLLGEAFGGGVSPLYPMSEAQQTQAGNAALLNFGINMLQNSSGPVRHSLGQAIASGLLGAQGSLAGVREGQAQMLDVQNKQQQMGLEKLKAILPILTLQQQMKASGAQTGALGGAAPGGGIAATGAPITAANQGDFVQKFTPIAQTIATKTGLPLNYVLGQAGLETGWGSSSAAGNNNYFGITDPTTGKLMSYPTPQAGADAYAALMATDRYKNVPRTGSPAEIGDAMAVAGYNPNVPTKGKTDSYGTRVGSFAAGLGKPPAPPTTAAAAPTPAPVARPPAAPAAPAGTIQGTPDTGGTQVGGPGALPGVIRPPGPLVPGDVGAIVGGMTKAGASPTTLAPGGGTAAPTAPTIAQTQPQPATPPAPTGNRSPFTGDAVIPDPHDTNASYPSFEYRPTPGLNRSLPPEAQQQFQQNEQQLLNARAASVPGSPQQKDYDQQLADLRKQHNQDIATYGQTQDTADSNRQLEGFKANAAAWNAIHQTQITSAADIAKARIQAGLDQETQAQKGDQERYGAELKHYSDAAGTATMLQPQYEQLRAVLADPNAKIPSGIVGGILQSHPNLAGYLSAFGVISGKDADQAQLINGLTSFLSTEMRPIGSGALRGQEMTNFKNALPTMIESPQGRQKALAFLLNYNDRVQAENEFAKDYYMRPDASGQQPIRNTLGLQKAMDAPVSQGGLGDVVPHMPTDISSYEDGRNWIQSNVQVGRPYYGPEALKDSKGRPLLNQDGSQRYGPRLQVRNN